MGTTPDPNAGAQCTGDQEAFEKLWSAKEEALVQQTPPGESDTRLPRAILSSLYRRNEAIARVQLYKDHANGYSRRPEKWEQLRLDIDRYEKARQNCQDLCGASQHRFAADEMKLVQLGAQLATVEDFEEQPGDAMSAALIDQANRELSVSAAAMFTAVEDGHHLRETDVKDSKSKDLVIRLAFALCGGLMMIIPVVIMKFVSDTQTILLTTSLFILATALILVVTMRNADSKDIVFATAAYAAVLVIFVANETHPIVYYDSEGYVIRHESTGEIVGIVAGVLAGTVVFVVAVSAFVLYGPRNMSPRWSRKLLSLGSLRRLGRKKRQKTGQNV